MTLISEAVDGHDAAVAVRLLDDGDAQEVLLVAAADHLAADGDLAFIRARGARDQG